MDISRVLIIYKKSLYQLYGLERKDAEYLHFLNADEKALQKALEGHEANLEALASARETLKKRDIGFDVRYRAKKAATSEYDLVITIGGDGTLLDASHAVLNVPILGINSAPNFSVGHFCSATHTNLGESLEKIQNGNFPELKLTRMRVHIGEEEIPFPVLNEILFSHPTPGAVTRLGLLDEKKIHPFKSSGIWIATASGSTGAIRSSGGEIAPIEGTDLQYRIREPYGPSSQWPYPVGGTISSSFAVQSHSRQGAVYVDGHRLKFRVKYGEIIQVTNAAPPLRIFHERERP